MKTPIGAFLTVLSLSLPAVAAIPTEYHVKGDTYASLFQEGSFSYNAGNLQQGLGTELPMGGGTLIAQANVPTVNGCATDGLNLGIVGFRVVEGKLSFVRRMATVLDPAVDDFGQNAGGDSLEIFCVSKSPEARFGKIAICLSGESCPWR